ncbi:flagellar basal body P-ring formation chaperone FlgA [Caldimonas tepidiphila]|uniref:flagellar basal body P-ring formation chaperone FlgA n=1 Tax=Caldimonas tepidiphila TaxID=2315841 RepID=UPI000E5C37A8|nr:flagellar basal body P-ring formation chaperone FlgA [Caldimonas tepidiphila]
MRTPPRRPAVFAILVAALLLAATPARADAAQAGFEPRLQEQALAWASALSGAHPGHPVRLEVRIDPLDPRMRLAPCQRIEPYLPAGVRPWGRSRIGVRCVEGPTRWSVFLPMTVRAWSSALVTAVALPAGHVLTQADLRSAEVDLAEQAAPAFFDAQALLGRTLARPLAAGQAVRATHLRARQFFATGDTVRLLAQGKDFSISGEGEAMQPGYEGRPVRVRTSSGRIVTGIPSAERTVQVQM